MKAVYKIGVYMLDRIYFLGIEFYKKESFTGSYKGMRFRLKQTEIDVPLEGDELEKAKQANLVQERLKRDSLEQSNSDDTNSDKASGVHENPVPLTKKEKRLEACHWPEPYNFANTSSDLKTYELFSFSDAGIDAAVEWLDKEYRNGI